jgi:hypothetical protein
MVGLVVLTGLALAAEALPDGGVTVDEMAGILGKKGFRAEIRKLKNGEQKIVSSAEGFTYDIFFYSMGENGRATSFQFCMALNLKNGISLEKVYEWNKEYRFARMYRDNEDDPVIEMDVDVEHGCTVEAIENNFERWYSLLNTFDKFVHGK